MANFTEKELLNTLKELLKDKSLDRITVKELTDRCGISRNTFYYHYHDIYELVVAYFVHEAQRIIGSYKADENWEGGFLEGLTFLYENRRVIQHIYKSVSRPQLDRFINDVVYHHAMILIRGKMEGINYSQRTLELATDFYKNALMGAVLQWIEGDMKDSPEELAAIYNSVFQGTVEHLFESLESAIEK
ncbi:MAG: TetR/AcrR family transcriptional regulator [Bacillota bacterium]|nr:TetR/AcrR family transcriptional regulator [Bacillota bacterium]